MTCELCVYAVVFVCIWTDFQLGDRPIGALKLCSPVEHSDHITVTQAPSPKCMSVTIKSKPIKTPCILRRRRRKMYANGKKSVVQCPKSSASTSTVSSPVIDCTQALTTGTDSCVTPTKDIISEQILPFSPSQVWIFSFIFAVMRTVKCCREWKTVCRL